MPSNPQDKIQVQAAVDTVKELLHDWIDRTATIPAVKKKVVSIQGNARLVTHDKKWAKEKGVEPHAYVKELEDRGEGALLKDLPARLAKYDADTQKLTEAIRTIRVYARQSGIKSKPLFQVFNRQQFDHYEDALLVLDDVEVALGAGGDEQSGDADYRDGPNGKLLTVNYCKERFGVSGKDLSTSEEAKKTRRKNPGGRAAGGDYVYRYDVVSRIANGKEEKERP